MAGRPVLLSNVRHRRRISIPQQRYRWTAAFAVTVKRQNPDRLGIMGISDNRETEGGRQSFGDIMPSLATITGPPVTGTIEIISTARPKAARLGIADQAVDRPAIAMGSGQIPVFTVFRGEQKSTFDGAD